MFKWRVSPKLQERADIAAKQMSYFRLFSQKGFFNELSESAQRAGFEVSYLDTSEKEALCQWPGDSEPDFTFFVSFADPEAVLVSAESYGDIFGLVMTSVSILPKIGVELKSALSTDEFGRNAVLFRELLLAFPDFDGGDEDLLRSLAT